VPEGDVVHRTAKRLDQALAGRVLTRTDLRWPSLATVDLRGRRVLEVVSAGKHLLTRIEGTDDATPLTLHSHLKMEGSWHIHRTGEPWGTRGARREEHGVRAVLENDEWTAVGHLLGMLDLVPTAEEPTLVGHLGPDLLGTDWDAAAAERNLRSRPDRPIGDALLDQTLLAGVGTFYMAEALFVRGIWPWTPVADVADLPGLLEVLHKMLGLNSERVPQTTTGDTRPGRSQWVHGRAGKPCRRCGTKIIVEPIGTAPRDRVAFYCPRCQPRPRTGGAGSAGVRRR
jgi:endonuclease-8